MSNHNIIFNNKTVFYAFTYTPKEDVLELKYEFQTLQNSYLILINLNTNKQLVLFINSLNPEITQIKANINDGYSKLFIYTDHNLYIQSLKVAYNLNLSQLEEHADNLRNDFLKTMDKITEIQNNLKKL